MPTRITQEVVEPVSGATANVRLTQEVAEPVSAATANLRLTQIANEVVVDATVGPNPAALRLTQIVVEVIVDAAEVSLTQIVAEVVLDAPGGSNFPLPTIAGIMPIPGQRRMYGDRLLTPVTLNAGGFTDCLGNPVAYGYLNLVLSDDQQGTGITQSGQVMAGQPVTVHLDAEGNVQNGGYFVWPNANGSFYLVKLYKADGTFAFTREYTMTIPDFTTHNVALLLNIE
jgi:hypothetical protein